jgi:hypothetical protein
VVVHIDANISDAAPVKLMEDMPEKRLSQNRDERLGQIV